MKVNKSLASIILESGGRMRYYAPKTRNARFLTAGDIEAPLRSMYKQDGIMNVMKLRRASPAVSF